MEKEPLLEPTKAPTEPTAPTESIPMGNSFTGKRKISSYFNHLLSRRARHNDQSNALQTMAQSSWGDIDKTDSDLLHVVLWAELAIFAAARWQTAIAWHSRIQL